MLTGGSVTGRLLFRSQPEFPVARGEKSDQFYAEQLRHHDDVAGFIPSQFSLDVDDDLKNLPAIKQEWRELRRRPETAHRAVQGGFFSKDANRYEMRERNRGFGGLVEVQKRTAQDY